MTNNHQPPPILIAPIAPLFFKMALPIIFGLLINGLFNFVDALFITWAVGTDAIGGVSAAFPIQMIMISISAMLGSGMASVISRRLGASQQAGMDDEASKVFSASLFFAALVGLVLSVVIVFFRVELFNAMQLPTALVSYAIDYLTPIAAIGVISFCHGTLSEVLRAQGLNVLVFKLMASMALMNIALDALFLFVFGWGVSGAAWATAISITFAFLFAVYLFRKHDHRICFSVKHFRLIPQLHKTIMALGMPVFLSYTGFAAMLLTVNIALVHVAGNDAQLLISAHGILNRVFMLVFLPVLGMMIAFQTIAGFNYGAQLQPRVIAVLNTALVVSTIYALLWSIIMVGLPEYIFQIFSNDSALVQTAADISRIVFLAFITVGVAMICPALFQAIGMATPAMILNALHTYFLLLPALGFIAYIHTFSPFFMDYFSITAVLHKQLIALGADSVWWLFPLTDGLAAILVGSYTWFFINRLKIDLK